MSGVVYDHPGVTVRAIEAEDGPAILAFAGALPVHDLLFLARDIRNERVVSAWLRAAADGGVQSLVALADGAIVATTALVRDGLGWSGHVAELRLLVAPAWRGKGLGRALLEASVRAAAADGAAKVVAYMTPDQRPAITVFEECGFRAEALLRDHVRDAAGDAHDLVLLSLDIGKAQALGEAYR